MPTFLLPLLWLVAVVANISANESVKKEKALTGAVRVFLKFMLTGDVIFLTVSVLTTFTLELVSGYYTGGSAWSSSIFSAIGHEKMSYFIRLLMTATASALTGYVWMTVVACAERYASIRRIQIASSRQWSTKGAYVALALVCVGSLAFNGVRFFEFELLQSDDSEDFDSRPDVVNADDYFAVEMLSSSPSSSVQASSFVFVTTWIGQHWVYRILYAYVLNYLVMFAAPLLALTFFHLRIARVRRQQQQQLRNTRLTSSTDSADVKSTSTSGSPRSSSIVNSCLDVIWRTSVILFISALFLTLSIAELVDKISHASSDPNLELPAFRAFPVSQTLMATVGRVTVYFVTFANMYIGVEHMEIKDESNVSTRDENDDDDAMINVITVGDAEPLSRKDDQLLPV